MTTNKPEVVGVENMRIRRVHGVGINDADYVTANCEYYERWASMLRRTSKPHIKRHPSYQGVSVCDAWLVFTTFKEWVKRQESLYGKEQIDARHLDKDILKPGNKVYSPENCCFVLQSTNKLFTDRAVARGDLPIGVTRYLRSGKWSGLYRSEINIDGKKRKLGYFRCPQEAHLAWIEAKSEQAIEAATREVDPRVIAALNAFCERSYAINAAMQDSKE